MAPRLGLTPPDVIRAFQGLRLLDLTDNRRLLTGPEPALERTARALAKRMVARRLLGAAPSPGPLTDARGLPNSAP